MSIEPLLARLSRRGNVTITARDGQYELSLKAPGPYQGRAWCTSDEADFWSHCRLGAHDWTGEGPDLAALVTACEDASRPDYRDVDDLRWTIDRRRESRTFGPPLPSYLGWRGWHPGDERWLRASSHKSEYLDGYLRYLADERKRAEADALRDERMAQRRRDETRRILTGGTA